MTQINLSDPASPTFFTRGPSVAAQSYQGLAVVDLTGDGILDLVARSRGSTNPRNFPGTDLQTVPGNGDGTFGAGIVTRLPRNLFDVGGQQFDLGDVNGDGRPDVVLYGATATIGSVNTVFTALGLANGSFATPTQVATVGPGAVVTLANVAGDGNLDLVAASNRSGVQLIEVLTGTGNGTFGAPVQVAARVSSLAPTDIAVTELTPGGGPAILVTSPSGTEALTVVSRNSDGSFGAPIVIQSAANVGEFELADLNGDGRIDVLTEGRSFFANSGAPPVIGGTFNITLGPSPNFIVRDQLTTAENRSLVFESSLLLGNDGAPGGPPGTPPQPPRVLAVGGAANGTVSLDGPGGNVTFTPAPGFSGQASFTYTAADGRGGVDQGQVGVTVDPLPPISRWRGDVHYQTVDDIAYDLQSAGEFVVTRATSGAPFEVQGRMEGAGASFFTQIAVRLGDARATFGLDRAEFLAVDGAPTALAIGATLNLSGGATVFRQTSTQYVATTAAGDTVLVDNNTTFIDAGASLSPTRAPGAAVGLLGNGDGVTTNDFRTRGGVDLGPTPTLDQIYRDFGDSWRISQAESLFDYRRAKARRTSSYRPRRDPWRCPTCRRTC